MHAELWYREFRKRFNPKKEVHVQEMYRKKGISARRWTELIAEMLKGLGEDLDYVVKKEESAFRKQRFDMKWENQEHDEIFIEYENSPRDIMESEVPKLLNASGRLRVLITYLPAGQFSGEVIVETMLRLLREKKRGESFEFLLVFGTYEMESPSDWVGWAFTPTYEARPLIVPSRLPYA